MTAKILPMSALLSAAWLAILSAGAIAEELGETLFKKNCAVCHTLEDGKNKIGPSLAGVVGRKAGSVPGFLILLPIRTRGIRGMTRRLIPI